MSTELPPAGNPSAEAPGGTLADRFGRPLRDLRISVTDRCNFRCRYCMPREVFGANFEFLPRDEILSFEEIARIAGIAAELGVRKIRLTGGEPTLRADLPTLVRMLREATPGVELAMTTNGSRLTTLAGPLAEAGLDRVAVSLDTLDDATFRAMNDADFPVALVIEGIEAAAAAGLTPIKINAVVKRGVNDERRRGPRAPLQGHGRGDALHRVHGRRRQQRLAAGRRGPGARADRADRRRAADRARRALVPRRGREALALPRRRRARSASSPRSRPRSAATARAPASPPTAASTPASSPSPGRTCAARCARAPTTPRWRRC